MSNLDADELLRLQDQSFLLAKKKIDQKVSGLLLASQQALADRITQHAPPLTSGLSLQPRKISKGENYADMPYWVSDFPADMKGKDLWTYRTVVWWGHSISFNLILAGKFKEAVKLEMEGLMANGNYFAMSDSPWRLEFADENLRACSDLSANEMQTHFDKNSFVKVSRQENLENINNLVHLSVLSFEKLINGLSKLA